MERIAGLVGKFGKHRGVIGRILVRVGTVWVSFALFAMFAASPLRAADTETRTIPTGLTATVISDSEILLTWNASTDADVVGYLVESCTGVGCTNFRTYIYSSRNVTTRGPGMIWRGLLPGTSYSFRVRTSYSGFNFSGYSTVVTAVTLGTDTMAPSVPANLSATVRSNKQIDLAWSASTDNIAVAGYRVERCQGSNCTDFAQIGAPTTTSYADSGRTPNTVYRYRVRAVDQANLLSDYSSIVTATTASGVVDCD